MNVLAIDPGTEQSAWVLYDSETKFVLNHGKERNQDVLYHLQNTYADAYQAMAIEMVAGYGKPVGVEIFETAVWIGRFIQACPLDDENIYRIYRREVKRHLCGHENGVNDAVIRQRLIDLFGPGKEKAIGLKAAPGPLYGLKADEWAALAVAVTWAEAQKK